MNTRQFVQILMLGTALCGNALAQDARVYSIEAQPLGAALKQFAAASGVQLLFSEADVGGRRAPALEGRFEREAALEKLLAGTGLKFSAAGPNTMVVQATPSPAATPVRQGAATANPTQTAAAQAEPAPASRIEEQAFALEEVTVTASRVARAGFTAPTPTTVLGPDDLQMGGATDVGEALFQIPSQRGTTSPTTFSFSVYGGAANADLRGLGPFRTLVLVDGRRQTPSSDLAFNLNQVPFSIVERLEVVTGGASAAWGSDAVAGVVNIMLNENLEGVTGNVQYGVSSRGDGAEKKASVGAGASFAQDRGHLLLGAEYVDNNGIVPRTSRDYFGKWALVANPAFTATNGQPQQIISSNAVWSTATRGGLITSGPLAGTQFLDGGATAPFQYGSLRGATFMVGGDANALQNDVYLPMSTPVERGNLYVRASYDLSDDLKFTSDFSWARSKTVTRFPPQSRLGTIIIRSDNAFLPAAIRTQMAAQGITQFNFGRINDDVGGPRNSGRYDTFQGTVGLEGELANNWQWDAYYSHGENALDVELANLELAGRFNAAIDSVVGPGGQPICRSTLAAPNDGCVPFNPFGPTASSQAARSYVTATASQRIKLDLDVAALTLRGEPFSTWAGPVSVALGGEMRWPKINKTVDPLSQARSFALLNFQPISGSSNVKEAFAETVVPLLRDQSFARSLEFNGAVRVSDYSLSGTITSWKAGLSYQVNDALRLRATRSRDIRAPNFTELYTLSFVQIATVIDPSNNVQSSINQLSRGSTALQPEKANTNTVGFVVQPSWLEGFRLSTDYYDIDIAGAITTVTGQSIITRCAAGNQALCALITRNAAGVATNVDTPFLNLVTQETSGFDIEAAYQTRGPFDGKLDLRFLANNVQKLKNNDGIATTNLLGNLGAGIVGVPKWRYTASANYDIGDFGFDLRARYIGSGNYNRTLNIDDNTVESMTYVDLGAEYRFALQNDLGAAVYFNVSNLFDPRPPKLPNPVFYDLVGRYFTFGVRMKY